MLTINIIREKRDFIIERLKVKNFNAEDIIRKILELDTRRREMQSRSDMLQGELNRISKEIGNFMRAGEKAEA